MAQTATCENCSAFGTAGTACEFCGAAIPVRAVATGARTYIWPHLAEHRERLHGEDALPGAAVVDAGEEGARGAGVLHAGEGGSRGADVVSRWEDGPRPADVGDGGEDGPCGGDLVGGGEDGPRGGDLVGGGEDGRLVAEPGEAGEDGPLVAEPADREPEVVPAGLPPAREARRFRGLAVPLVAAIVVAAIGYPLTALAVSQVDRLPGLTGPARAAEDGGSGSDASSGVGEAAPDGKASLKGAVTLSGPATSLGCASPKLVLIGPGAGEYSILLSVPDGAGTYQLESTADSFIAVARLTGGAQMWTSRGRPNASGEVTVKGDKISAKFRGLEPGGGGAEGTLEGSLEVRCA